MDLDQLDTRDNSTSSSSDSWSNDDAPEPTSTQLPKINTQSPKRKRSKDKNEKPKKKQKTSPQSSQKSKKRTSPIKTVQVYSLISFALSHLSFLICF
jgi:hypothetical protein